MTFKNQFTNLLLTSLICAATLMASTAHAQDTHLKKEVAFAQAMDAYQQGNWPEAYMRLAALAEQDHADAARIALFMHRFGKSLYGGTHEVTKTLLDQWLRIASRQNLSMKEGVGN